MFLEYLGRPYALIPAVPSVLVLHSSTTRKVSESAGDSNPEYDLRRIAQRANELWTI